jgi:GT2 family glycosyltransferase
VAVLQNMRTRIDFNDIENPDLSESPKFNIVLSKSNNFSDEAMLVCKKELEAQANANVKIHVKIDQGLLAADNARTLEVLIHGPVRFDPKFLDDVLKIFIETDTALLYSDFKVERNGAIEGIKLPTWSPLRYESIDYLGPVIVLDLDKLKLAASDTKSRESAIQKSQEDQARISRLPRYAYTCEMWEASIKSLELTSTKPDLISIIIPTQGLSDDKNSLLERCLNSVAKQEVDSKVEVIVVADTSFEPEVIRKAQELLEPSWTFKLIEFTEPFNFSKKCNVGTAESSGSALLFLNDDVELVSVNLIQKMIELSIRRSVGAVGCQLRFSDSSIQHAGITLSQAKPRNSYLDQFTRKTPTGDLECIHEVSAATGACLALSKEDFVLCGGWNEDLPNSYNDVDLSLRLNHLGLQSVIRNDVFAIHHESSSRDETFDMKAFRILKNLWPTDLGSEMYLRSKEANGQHQGPWGEMRKSHVDSKLGFGAYAVLLYRTSGFLGLASSLFNRLAGRTSRFLSVTHHEYL